MHSDFVAIDFETANYNPQSACAVGIVTVSNNIITDEYYTLIQPPQNFYTASNIMCHGITPEQTLTAPTFENVYHEFEKRMKNKIVVAHNESFDRNVLKSTMQYYDLSYFHWGLPNIWQCTLKIYRQKGFKPASLNACCSRMDIELQHHNALSDARACALLYIRQ